MFAGLLDFLVLVYFYYLFMPKDLPVFLCMNKSKMFPTLLKTPKNTHMQFGGSPTPVGTQRSWNGLATKPLQRLAANYVQQAIFPASIRCQVWLYCVVCVPFPVKNHHQEKLYKIINSFYLQRL